MDFTESWFPVEGRRGWDWTGVLGGWRRAKKSLTAISPTSCLDSFKSGLVPLLFPWGCGTHLSLVHNTCAIDEFVVKVLVFFYFQAAVFLLVHKLDQDLSRLKQAGHTDSVSQRCLFVYRRAPKLLTHRNSHQLVHGHTNRLRAAITWCIWFPSFSILISMEICTAGDSLFRL